MVFSEKHSVAKFYRKKNYLQDAQNKCSFEREILVKLEEQIFSMSKKKYDSCFLWKKHLALGTFKWSVLYIRKVHVVGHLIYSYFLVPLL